MKKAILIREVTFYPKALTQLFGPGAHVVLPAGTSIEVIEEAPGLLLVFTGENCIQVEPETDFRYEPASLVA